MSNVGSVLYSSSTTTTMDVTLQTSTVFSQAANGNDVVEKFINLNPDAVAQVETITITTSVPVVDSYFRVAIDDVGTANDRVYTLEFLTASGLTAPQIASRLAELINTNPDLRAVAVTNTIVITGATPGASTGAFTCTVGCFAKTDNSAVAGKIATVTTTPASGTGKVRKLAKFEVQLASNNGTPELRVVSGIWYNGAEPGVQSSAFGPIPFTSSLKYDTLRQVS